MRRRERPAPAWQATLAMAGMELRLDRRRGENLLATAVLPVVVLVFFTAVPLGGGPARPRRPSDFLLPGVARPRDHRHEPRQPRDHDRLRPVLRRPQAARRVAADAAELIAAKILVVPVVEAVQVVLLIGVALAPGLAPPAGLVAGRRPGRASPSGRSPSPGSGCARRDAPGRDDARGRQRPVPREPRCSAASCVPIDTCRAARGDRRCLPAARAVGRAPGRLRRLGDPVAGFTRPRRLGRVVRSSRRERSTGTDVHAGSDGPEKE